LAELRFWTSVPREFRRPVPRSGVKWK